MCEITVHLVADDFQDCFDMKFSLFPTQWIFFLSSKVKVHIGYCIMYSCIGSHKSTNTILLHPKQHTNSTKQIGG